MARKPDRMEFIVRYKDSREFTIWIPWYDRQRNGDHLARIIAGERRRKGEIPEGEIESVRSATTLVE
jgi:hypothetical protein